jgi:hypothetical protein
MEHGIPNLRSDIVTVIYLRGASESVVLYDAPRGQGGNRYQSHKWEAVDNFLPVLHLLYSDMALVYDHEFTREEAMAILEGGKK